MKKAAAVVILVLTVIAFCACEHPYWGDAPPSALADTPVMAAIASPAPTHTPMATPMAASAPTPALSLAVETSAPVALASPSASAATVALASPSPSVTIAGEHTPAASPSEAPASDPPSIALQGAYTADPAWEGWAGEDAGLPISKAGVYTAERRLFRNDAWDIAISTWDGSQPSILAYNAGQALWYRGFVYYLKANCLYRVGLDGSAPVLIREFDQRRFTREYAWQPPQLSYSSTVTQIYIAGGRLYYILDFSAVDVDFSAEYLYRMDLSGRNIRLIRQGVRRISHYSGGVLYLDIALGHWRALSPGNEGAAYDGYDYVYDIVGYSVKTGASAVLVQGAEQAAGGSQTLWLGDRCYYHAGTWMDAGADPALYELDLRSGGKRPAALPAGIWDGVRFGRFLFYGMDAPGGLRGVDLATGQHLDIRGCDALFLADGEAVVRNESGYYRLRFENGVFDLTQMEPTVN